MHHAVIYLKKYMTGKMNRMHFLGRNFVSGLLCRPTLKLKKPKNIKKTFKNLKKT